MSYQVLARKWRPSKFSELVGQEHVVSAISHALNNDRLHHAYLFTGTRGVGKTTIARIFSKSLNCEKGQSADPCGVCDTCVSVEQGNYVDLLEIDAASRTKVEDTRELLDNVQYKPTRGRFKVYLIDEVHMLSKHSFNALLKTLEEPPPHVKFLLATTDPQKLPITILSRCLQFNLKALSREQIGNQLEHVLNQEKVHFESSALSLLARAAQGSMRDALSLTDQAIAQGNNQVVSSIVSDMLGLMDKQILLRLLSSTIERKTEQVLEIVEQLSQQAPDYGYVLAEISSLLHQIAMTQWVPDVCKLETTSARAIYTLAKRLSPEHVQLLYKFALEGKKELPLSVDGRTCLEMTLMRMVHFSPLELGSIDSEAEVQSHVPISKNSNSAATQHNQPMVVDKIDEQSIQADAIDKSLVQSALSNSPNEKLSSDSAPTASAVLTNFENRANTNNTQTEAVEIEEHENRKRSISVSTHSNEHLKQAEESEYIDNQHITHEGDFGFDLVQNENIEKDNFQVGNFYHEQENSEAPFTEKAYVSTPLESDITSNVSELSKESLDNEQQILEQQKSAHFKDLPLEEEPVQLSGIEKTQALLALKKKLSVGNSNDSEEKSVKKPLSEHAEVVQESALKPSFPLSSELDSPQIAVTDVETSNHDSANQSSTDLTTDNSPPWQTDTPKNNQNVDRTETFVSSQTTACVSEENSVDSVKELKSNEITPFLADGIKLTHAKQINNWSLLIEQSVLGGLDKQVALNSNFKREGSEITLLVDFSQAHLISDVTSKNLAHALGQTLNQTVTVNIEMGEPQDTPQQIQDAIKSMRQSHAHKTVESDKLINHLVETFNATVDVSSIKAR